jgi:porphobilinogen synthase
MSFPESRPRRLRRTAAMRSMIRETEIGPERLIYPLFVVHGSGVRKPIATMPGCDQLSVDLLVEEAAEAHQEGVGGVILFGIPKKKIPGLPVWADVCLCEYTDHGHCGVIREDGVDNDATLPLLARAAVVYAGAGADIVAPSDMMDGRVGAIRTALDESGFAMTPIVSYAAKYASAYYGPFREAAESAPRFGDRRAYQMDPRNAEEAIREVALDLEEGADVVMVKPALPYLDIIRRVKDQFSVPVAAYNVSGEYSLIKAAAEKGWIDEKRVIAETLLSIRRAGADIILTYFAKEGARILKEVEF